MEHVVVSYETARDVYIDGQIAGTTNDTLMVEAGHHKFDLGDPKDYTPVSVEKDVQNTTSLSPNVIDEFHPDEGTA